MRIFIGEGEILCMIFFKLKEAIVFLGGPYEKNKYIFRIGTESS